MGVKKSFTARNSLHNIFFEMRRENVMIDYATVVYVISDDLLRTLKFKDDPQVHMTNAEVITFAILSAKLFYGNFKRARFICKELKLFKNILSNSRLNRRIHAIPLDVWMGISRLLALIFIQNDADNEYSIDSFPVSYCEKSRIDKRKIFIKKEYIGFAASKKRYFCGIKVHMVVTSEGKPIEFEFRPASENDLSVLWEMKLDIPPNSKLYADGAYNCFELEDVFSDESIHFFPKRGSKAKNRVRPKDEEKVISSKRQIVETAFSCITDLFPRNLRVNTEQGFYIKIHCFILAYSMNCLCNMIHT